MSSPFAALEAVAVDPILKTVAAYKLDPAPNRLNLAIGVYQDEHGKTPIMECVRKASLEWLNQEDSKDYLPADGLDGFLQEAARLFFADKLGSDDLKRIVTVQTIGGNGALRLAAEMVKEYLPKDTIHVSSPTWDNHNLIFERAGCAVESYPYYNPKTQRLDLDNMLSALKTLPAQSVVLLHASCHNPTGIDPNKGEWDQIIDLLVKQNLIPFIDCAYQGFSNAKSDDLYIARRLLSLKVPFLAAYSFSKSFALYRERVGALFVVTDNENEAKAVRSRLVRAARTSYSRPPSWGAQVVRQVLASPDLYHLWQSELSVMRDRVIEVRQLFAEQLESRVPGFKTDGIRFGNGLFTLLDLTPQQVLELQQRFHLYILESGRICLAALNRTKLEYVTDAIKQVVRA